MIAMINFFIIVGLNNDVCKGRTRNLFVIASVLRFSELLLLIRHNKRFVYYKKKGIFSKITKKKNKSSRENLLI